MKKEKKKKITTDQDLILLNKIIKKRCNDSFLTLKDRHEKLFYSVCNRFVNRLSLEEVHKDIDFVFFKAIVSFKLDKKAKFSTWLGNYTRYHCLNYIKKNSKYISGKEEVISHFFNKKSVEDFAPVEEFRNDVDHAFEILSGMKDKRIHRVFSLRYLHKGQKLTWKQIAEKFDLTPQTIINLHAKGRRTLMNKMKKNEIFGEK
jgi:RNA polymerase sigma factor (sigma-70 family)